MNSLKTKLAISYAILIVITLGVSGWAIYHLIHLGRSVDVILVNNYKSILAAENMKESLERVDSSAMFLIASNPEKAQRQYADNIRRFEDEFKVAAGNVTEAGEDQIIARIDLEYRDYKKQVDQFLSGPRGPSTASQSEVYFKRLEPAFLGLKAQLDELLRLNQRAMVSASERAQAESLRAELSTALVAAAGLVFALLFAWRFTTYVVDPIALLAEKAKLIGEGDFDQHIDLSSKDEIGFLAGEFNRMLVRLRELRKSEYGRLLIEQKKADVVIDSIGEPVIVTDSNNRVIKTNRAARELFTGSQPRSGDLDLERIASAEPFLSAVHDAVSMQRTVATDSKPVMVPIQIDGELRDFRVRATPMRDGQGRLLGAVTLLEDITAITELDKLKTEFVAVASSKLGEPLNALRLALHALNEGYIGELTEEQNRMAALARDNADKLNELMNDLVELSEVDSGARRISFERLRPIDLAREAVDRFRAAAEVKQIKLDNLVWPDLSWVVADHQMTARILDNLLSNAIRHTERNGTIKIEASEHVGRIHISVKDTGEGIPEQQLPKIFSRFSRIGDKPGGTGLGLALVKRFAEAQGGQVSVESRLGEGSTFTVALTTGGPASIRHTA